MGQHDKRALNDAFRTTFKGGIVCMTPSVYQLEPRLRGRAFDRLTRITTFHPDSDHSEGVFVFAGYSWVWRIEDFAGERTLTLGLQQDL